MLNLVAETNEGLARLPEGLAANSRALELLRAHGGSAPDISATLSTRGELIMLQGRYHDAYAALTEAVALVETQRGAEKQLAVALDDLGDAYQESREKDAEIMYKRAIEVYRRAGPPLTATSAAADPVANLGVLYLNEGRMAEAVDYMRKAVDMRRKSLPPDHPDLLDVEYNYATALESQDQAKTAEPIFRELLATYTRILGSHNVNTLVAAQGVAHNLLKQKRYEEAMSAALPAAQGLSEVVGDGHQWTQTAWGVYGVSACLAGHGEEGLTALRRVAVLRRTGVDTVEWRKHITDIQIGTCLVAQKKYQEAEPLLLATVSGLEAERGTTYETTRDGYRALRDLYAQTGRADESARWEGKLARNVP
jgi:tetratricopeptide (TPR) repeat protein